MPALDSPIGILQTGSPIMNDNSITTPKPASTASPVVSAMPMLFVLLWSTGFIGGRMGIPYSEPMTFMFLRYAGAVVIFLGLSVWGRAPWPQTWQAIGHFAVAGLFLHILYIGGMLHAYARGVEAGTAALVISLQPLFIAVIVGPFLGERVTGKQWLGLLIGLGGVALVVWQKLGVGIGSPTGVGFVLLALTGATLGTVYQKRFCSESDLRTSTTIQYAVATIAAGLLSLSFESQHIEWTGTFVFSLVWLTLLISCGAIGLLFMMIRRGAVARVASLFYLIPAVTALMAWPMFGEQFGPLALTGMGLAVCGVLLARGQG